MTTWNKNMKWSFGIVLLVLCLVTLGSTGCGSNGNARVTGVVLDGGKPIQVKAEEELSITFHAAKPGAQVDLASVHFDPATSSFTVHGPTGEGLPPGDYKIAITCNPYQEEAKDRFSQAFSAEKTPLRYTVSSTSSQELVIDVAAKSVTKKG